MSTKVFVYNVAFVGVIFYPLLNVIKQGDKII